MIENIYSLPWAKGCSVLEKNKNGLVIIEKAEGVLSHPNKETRPGIIQNRTTLLGLTYDHKEECYITPKANKLYLLHRLDSPTSGLIMIALNKTLAGKMKVLFRKNMINKTYHALITQKQSLQVGSWIDSLVERRAMGKIRVSRGKGLIAKTQCYLEKTIGGPHKLVLLRLKPQTGRTHQLRVQAAARNMPIIGDRTYGDYSINRNLKKETKVSRMLLHASSIEFNLDSKVYKYKSCLPSDFNKLDRAIL